MNENSHAIVATDKPPLNGHGQEKPEQQGRNWGQLRASRDEWRKRAETAEAEVERLRRAPAPETVLREAYQRGRADLQAEIVFAERLAAIRSKYVDFDLAWASVRPLVPRVVWEEASDLEHGLEAAYQLAKVPELCRELSALGPEKARERFRFFVGDLMALRGTR
jgi:hypothetical protein